VPHDAVIVTVVVLGAAGLQKIDSAVFDAM
jgi:hypothetical protein